MCEEMCITPGEDDDTSQAMDSDIKEIARMLTELNELAYNTYKPLVDDICARKAPEAEVEHLLLFSTLNDAPFFTLNGAVSA